MESTQGLEGLNGEGHSQADGDANASFEHITPQHRVEGLMINGMQSPADRDFTAGQQPQKHPGGAELESGDAGFPKQHATKEDIDHRGGAQITGIDLVVQPTPGLDQYPIGANKKPMMWQALLSKS